MCLHLLSYLHLFSERILDILTALRARLPAHIPHLPHTDKKSKVSANNKTIKRQRLASYLTIKQEEVFWARERAEIKLK